MKLSRIQIGHSRLNHGHLMSRNEQPTYRNAAYGNIDYKNVPNGGTAERNTISSVTYDTTGKNVKCRR